MKKNRGKKDNAAVLAQSLRSGKDFVALRLEGVKAGKIKPTDTAERRNIAKINRITLKQVEIDFLSACEQYVSKKPTIEVLSNSSGSAMKSVVTLDGHSLNPLQQAKDASRSVVEYRHVAAEMEGLFDVARSSNLKTYRYEGSKIHAYAGVFSFANCSKGQLKSSVDALNKFASDFWKKLKDAHNRDGRSNRLRTAPGEIGFAAPVGMLFSNEMTINTDKLQSMNGKGIYHPHIHFIMFTDKPLSDGVCNDMYSIWDGLTGNTYKTDKQAFSFAPVYSKSDDGSASDDGSTIADSLKEVTKYLMDPAKWDLIALGKDDAPKMRKFKIELFAEYFNAYAGRKRTRTYGLLRTAQSFVNRFSDFEHASIFNGTDILGDILTQLNELKFDNKTNKYNFVHVRALTSDEIIHENRTLLSRILVSQVYKNELDDFADAVLLDLKNDTDRLFAMYFKQKEYHNNLSDLYAMFDRELDDISNSRYKMPTNVFSNKRFVGLFGESFEVGNFDHFKKFRVMIKDNDDVAVRDAVQLFGKACDIRMLKDSLQSLVSLSGESVKYARAMIDDRIFEQRKLYRDLMGTGYQTNINIQLNHLFYKTNGMVSPLESRSHETMSLFVDERDEDELFDLFRVPEEAREQIKQRMSCSSISGVAA